MIRKKEIQYIKDWFKKNRFNYDYSDEFINSIINRELKEVLK